MRKLLEVFGNLRGVSCSYFENMDSRVKKRSLSAHQKQIWFLTGLSVFIIALVTVLIFWLANQPGFPTH